MKKLRFVFFLIEGYPSSWISLDLQGGLARLWLQRDKKPSQNIINKKGSLLGPLIGKVQDGSSGVAGSKGLSQVAESASPRVLVLLACATDSSSSTGSLSWGRDSCQKPRILLATGEVDTGKAKTGESHCGNQISASLFLLVWKIVNNSNCNLRYVLFFQ